MAPKASVVTNISVSSEVHTKTKWAVDKPNYIHQADLLFLSSDHGDKNALVVVDVASRYVDAEPLSSKNLLELLKRLKRSIRKALKFPHTLIVDPGKEFMGDVTKLMKEHNVRIKRSEAKNHGVQAVVERANRTLSEKLFSHQYAQEFLMDEG